MKKIFTILVLLSGTVSAQSLSKGVNLIGSDISVDVTTTGKSSNLKSTVTSLSLIPSFERMLSDRVSVNLNVGFSAISSTYKGTNISSSSDKIKVLFFGKSFSGGFNYYVSKNEKANFFLGTNYQFISTKAQENNKVGITGNEKSSVNFININAGCLYSIKPNLYLSSKINLASFSFDLKEEGLKSDSDGIKIGNQSMISLGIRKSF